ncbi:polysaccharide biosynthesis/export family protein [Sphingosinicella sp. LHD-64]|uniref:polysaccharide biosynthesis/export family protein n=1 Tax=Sphingosinicella sp. LHD-64 TaxID=3072139 RepID=UPI00280FCB7E|nr:polysaccharide biosynthesis/export family protein [Sphingosinicella sp. LHD-64]MDQ8757236.1 polysaccharide biosynthesis/export family protein [Sphingosinicella sp. LHD-64]
MAAEFLAKTEGYRTMRLWTALAIGVSFSIAGCSSGPALQTTQYLTVSDTGTLPPPTIADLTAPAQAQLIGPLDRLSIEVYGIDELGRTVQTDNVGNVTLPLAGEIPAAGLTPQQLAHQIEQRLSGRYVRNPQVTVNIEESANRFVTIDGEVRRPGVVPLGGRMSLSQLVARAQGTTEFARLSHVVLFRTVEGQRMAALYDLRAIRAGLYPDPEIYSQDTVLVGESQARRIFRDILQGSTLLTTPIIALVQR